MLELDYTNVLDSTIGGSHGIPQIAFDKVSESSKHVVEHIQKAHEHGEVGFGNLPFDESSVKAVASFARSHGQRVLVVFPYSQSLWKFSFWFKQLWGESLGKKLDRRGRDVYYGQTPTAALGVTDQHSQLQLFIEGPNDKSFLFWDVKEFRNP